MTKSKNKNDEVKKDLIRFKDVLDSSFDAIGMATPDGKHFYQNKTFDEMFGEVEDNRPHSAFVDQDVAKVIFDNIMSGKKWTGEVKMYGKNKEVLDVLVRAYPVMEDDKIVTLVGVHTDITKRKQAEEALLQETDRAKRYLEIAGVMFVALNTRGEVTLINKKGSEVLGYQQEEIIGKNWFDNFLPENLRKEVAPVFSSLMKGEISPVEYYENPVLTKNGKERVIAWHNTVLKDDENKIIGTLSSGEDVTERKQAERALRQSEQRFRELFEKSRDGFVIVDLKGQLVDANPAYCKMLGYSLEELMRMDNLLDVTPNHWHEWEKTEIWEKRLLHEGYSGNFEKEYIRKDGTVFPIEAQACTVFDDQGESLYIWAIVRNITDRKQAETELRHLRKYLTNIINSMPFILIGVDSTLIVTQWNETAEGSIGIDASDAMGKSLSEVFPRLAKEAGEIVESIKRHQIKQQKKRPYLVDGETHYEDVTIYPLIGDDVEGAVICIENVTEQVRMEEMMIQSEKMLSVGGLAAGMAHEINNPLAGIMQTAHVVADRLTALGLPENIRTAEELGTSMDIIKKFMESRDIPSMLSTINESGKRVAAIVNNMLTFARKGEKWRSSVSILKILEKTFELADTDYDLKKRYDFRRIKIIKEYQEDLPSITCEEAKIQQVLLNVIRNAAQAMHEAKTEEPCIVIRGNSEAERDMVCIEIEDNGPGMDEETRKRVFEPFFTTKPVGIGTGLGLSVSYFIIAENHGGEMIVESQLGSGSKFIIRLPVKS